MPNWVYNTLAVRGPNQVLDQFKKQASQPYITKHYDFLNDAYGEQVNEGELLFWNFVKPDDSVLDEYFGPEPKSASLEEALSRSTNHWYDWNHRNWGTKWDACDPEIVRESEGTIVYRFRTAWSPAEPVFEEMARQYPQLHLDIHCEEEQGWGMQYISSDGQLSMIDSWDIPEEELV
jgi:hypothetical protein